MGEFSKDEGYIKLYRSMLDWERYLDSNTKDLFIHLLLKANYKTRRYNGMTIPRGSLFTSTARLAAELALTPKKIRISLDKLEHSGEIVKKGRANGQLITVVNYAFYQGEGQATGQAKGEPRASQGQAKGNNLRKKEEKEGKKERITLSQSLSQSFLDLLSEEQLDRMEERLKNDQAFIDLVDLMDRLDLSSIKSPYNYAMRVAEERGWLK